MVKSLQQQGQWHVWSFVVMLSNGFMVTVNSNTDLTSVQQDGLVICHHQHHYHQYQH